MILNVASLKTEALLLFCRDLINTYNNEDKNNEAKTLFVVDTSHLELIQNHINTLQKGIDAILQPNDYYVRNMRVTRIGYIIKFYNKINTTVSNFLKEDRRFNPSMLLFSMLATWFKELGHEYDSKEFIFFSIYPYGEIYDNLLLDVKDDGYKKLNIHMIEIAEKIIIKLQKEQI